MPGPLPYSGGNGGRQWFGGGGDRMYFLEGGGMHNPEGTCGAPGAGTSPGNDGPGTGIGGGGGGGNGTCNGGSICVPGFSGGIPVPGGSLMPVNCLGSGRAGKTGCAALPTTPVNM